MIKDRSLARRIRDIDRYILSTFPKLYISGRRDGSSFISDDAFGHVCTVTGATWGNQGRTFDGSDDLISISSPFGDTNFAAQAISVVAWLNTDTLNAFRGYLEITPTTVTKYAISLFKNNTNTIMANWRQRAGAGSDLALLAWPTVLVATTWYHIVVTYDGSGTPSNTTAKCYINGVLEGAPGAGASDNVSPVNNTILIGKAMTNYLWDGLIGEVQIYNRVLSATEIQNIHQITAWKYR